MPTPSQLKLDPPVFEEDIGDLSPYLALPSADSRASSASINSFTSSPGFTTDDELDHPSSPETPRKQSFGFHLAPSNSSHSLAASVSRPQDTLPLQRGDSSPRPLRKEIDALEVNSMSVTNIRRWILGIAVGESARLPDCD